MSVPIIIPSRARLSIKLGRWRDIVQLSILASSFDAGAARLRRVGDIYFSTRARWFIIHIHVHLAFKRIVYSLLELLF